MVPTVQHWCHCTYLGLIFFLKMLVSRPPLIPYMGLVLQDLTFVHIGNSDNVKGGRVNFAKRWQQYNILVSQ